MKTIFKTAVLGPAFVLMFIGDVPPEFPLHVQLVPEAHAIFGFWRRQVRRTVIIGSAAAATAAAATEAAAAEKQAAAAKQEAAAQQQAAAAAAKPPPPPAPAAGPLPLGTVVHALPAGCVSTPVGGVEYYYCGGNFYRAVFQGNQLVYVTAQP